MKLPSETARPAPALLLFLLFLTLYSTAGWSQEIEEATLANGLKVIVSHDPRAPYMSTQLWLKTGETSPSTGLNPLPAQKLQQEQEQLQSANFRGRLQLSSRVENAYRIFTHEGPAGYLEQSLYLHSLSFFPSPFSRDELAEFSAAPPTQDAAFKHQRALILFPDKADLSPGPDAGDNLARLNQWQKTHYVPEQSFLIIRGNFPGQSPLQTTADYLSAIPIGEQAAIKQTATNPGRHLLPLKKAFFSMNYPISLGNLRNEEKAAVFMALDLLMWLLREDLKATLVLAPPLFPLHTYFSIEGEIPKGMSVTDVESLLRASIDKYTGLNISPDLLRTKIRRYYRLNILALDQRSAAATSLARFHQAGLPLQQPHDFFRQYQAINALQLQQTALKYLKPENSIIIYSGEGE